MELTDQRFAACMEPYREPLRERGWILAGYSGGADSSCLLALLEPWCRENGVRLAAAHINHGIRGRDADRDEDFCRRTCAERGIRFFSLRADVPALAKAEKTGIEETARRVRYDFFDEVSKELTGSAGGAVIATAHNADDNLETVLFHLLRGSGLRGLCGIEPFRDQRFLRPLLSFSSVSIRQWCSEHGVAYVTDATNEDTDYTRNRIRHTIVPQLAEITPDPAEAAARLTSSLREDSDFLEAEAERAVCGKQITRDVFLSLHPAIASRVLRILYDRSKDSSSSLEQKHIRTALSLIQNGNNGSRLSLPGKMQLLLDSGVIRIVPDSGRRPVCDPSADEAGSSRSPALSSSPVPVFSGDEVRAVFSSRVYSIQISLDDHNNHGTNDKINENIYKLSILTTLRFDKISGVLQIRSRLPGDTIRTGGMTHKVKRLFCDRKMSAEERVQCPILLDDEGIVFIPGFPPRDGLLYDGTGTPLYIRWTSAYNPLTELSI
ncbi:MAG: tRNA lysidine(34) synthetase TilS [Clostridia bacterium]|nr:tRNA lysidine(34) synthetase TilS [Clostridia bacterium]